MVEHYISYLRNAWSTQVSKLRIVSITLWFPEVAQGAQLHWAC